MEEVVGGGGGDGDGDGHDELISTVRSSPPHSPPPPPPPPPPETSSLRSPDDDLVFLEEEEEIEFHEEEAEALAVPSSAADPLPSTTSEAVVLTDDLKEKIIRQVEYYFSDENLPTDKFLMKYVSKDKDGFVPVAVVSSFRKMKKLVHDKSLLVAALRESSQLILSSSGKKVRRVHPLPIIEAKDAKMKDSKLCTVLVENLPDNCSRDDLRKIFGEVGKISSILIRDPHGTDDSTKAIKGEVALSGKRHALVEYETVKEAEKAVATLNDEKSWRNGMRVEHLLKRMSKYGLAKKGWKGVSSEKNDNHSASHAVSSEQNVKSHHHHDEAPDQEETEHSLNEKAGRSRRGTRGRGQGQYRGNKQHYSNGHGHGSVPTGSRSEVHNKPPPGPRMPDGTRGFALGRGRPPPDHNRD